LPASAAWSAKVTADIKLARGEFSIDNAARYLAATVPMHETTARQDAALFASTPGSSTSAIQEAWVRNYFRVADNPDGESSAGACRL